MFGGKAIVVVSVLTEVSRSVFVHVNCAFFERHWFGTNK